MPNLVRHVNTNRSHIQVVWVLLIEYRLEKNSCWHEEGVMCVQVHEIGQEDIKDIVFASYSLDWVFIEQIEFGFVVFIL